MFGDTLLTVSFGSTFVRFSEKEVSSTFTSFMQAMSVLGYNWPGTIILFLNTIFPTAVILIGAIVF